MKAVMIEATWNPRPEYVVSERETATGRAENGNGVWKNPRISVKEHPDPTIQAADDVLLKVRGAGICGSDVYMSQPDADGYLALAYRTKFPLVLGHEFCGEVVEVGSGVTRLRVGDAVAVEEITWCGECRNCQRGLLNQCIVADDYGFTLDGGFAEYVLVKERYCCSLNSLRDIYDEDKVYTIGAVTEPTSVAYQGMFRMAGGFEPGSSVGIFGCGPIGLAGVQLARAAGAGKVIAIETQASRRSIAAASGADLVLDPAELARAGSSVAEEIMHYTGGVGLQMAVEASGVHSAVFPMMQNCLDAHAKVALIGVDAHPAPFEVALFQWRGARLYGSVGHCGGAFGRTIALHAAGRIDMTSVVTSEFKLADGVEAVKQTSRKVDAKVLIRP
jgi:threonine dehydrogenase-like Zn-dependent dehydrogenase